MNVSENRAKVMFCNQKFLLPDLENSVWQKSTPISLDYYWSGVKVENKRQTQVRLLWNAESLFVRFNYQKNEPLVINSNPNLSQKTILLWEKDVCEIFLSPQTSKITQYYEFEVAPTGEWIDLKLRLTAENRETDWDYQSKMKTAVKLSDDEIILAMEIPWQAFPQKPQVGDYWRGNLFRCCGKAETRGYLVWLPTLTATPNFHIPEKFGYFEFLG